MSIQVTRRLDAIIAKVADLRKVLPPGEVRDLVTDAEHCLSIAFKKAAAKAEGKP